MSTPKNTLIQWFKNGKKPNETQFEAWFNSYWHKEEPIPIDIIENINTILQNKADIELVNTLIKELEGKVNTEVVEALETYIYSLIDDSLQSAADKTYSIDKIRELFFQSATNIEGEDPLTVYKQASN